MGVWGGTRPRIHTILPGIIIAGVFPRPGGGRPSADHCSALAIFMFLMLVPMPMINAAAMSLMQAKVPPDIQGRVFAAMGQMAMVLDPAVPICWWGRWQTRSSSQPSAKPGWERVAPLVGNSAGRAWA